MESTALSELNEQGYVKLFRTKSLGLLPIDVLKDWAGLNSTFIEAREHLDSFNPDVVYARYSLYQPFYRRIGERFKLIVEVNTDFESEYFLLRKEGIKRYLRFLYYKCTNSLFLKSVSGIAAVTNELGEKYTGRPTAVFPNSLKVSDYKISSYKPNSNELSMIFLGTPGMAWHGIDILIEMAKILNHVKFHIVGYSSTDLPDVPDNVLLHGFLKKEEYLKYINQSTAAIGTLALHRKKMKEACPLKIREYLACCKPLVVPYKETAFEMKGYPDWALRVDFEKDGIASVAKNINTFLERCHEFNLRQEDVLQYIDVSEVEKLRLQFFERVRANEI
ncbi:hypothetical protein [Zobellia russellii]|uniref:hypothetical protein n=1 Tax=Zobellia russellii TaxID=248907 RepID=UPI0037DD3234